MRRPLAHIATAAVATAAVATAAVLALAGGCTAPAPTPDPERTTLPYWDATLPVPDRVADLLARMDLADKVGQVHPGQQVRHPVRHGQCGVPVRQGRPLGVRGGCRRGAPAGQCEDGCCGDGCCRDVGERPAHVPMVPPEVRASGWIDRPGRGFYQPDAAPRPDRDPGCLLYTSPSPRD